MKRNNELRKGAQQNTKVVVMRTDWTSGEGTFKIFEEEIEDFIRGHFIGKFKIVAGKIRENKFLDYEYFLGDAHIASLKGKFDERYSRIFNPEKWCEESILNEWSWCVEWYWAEMEFELRMRFGNTQALGFEEDDCNQNDWTSDYGGKEGEDFFIDKFGIEWPITGCMQLREDSFDDPENV